MIEEIEQKRLRVALERIRDQLAPLAVPGGGSSLDKSYDTALAALADDGSGYDYNNSSDDFRDLLVRHGERSETHFNPIKVGRFSLSIQASKYHYSKPRETGLSPKDYERFEVALFFDEKWVKFRKWKLYYRGPWMKFHEGFDLGVFAYMPANIVQKLYERIKLLDKLSPPKLSIPERAADGEKPYRRHATKQNGDCADWCLACKDEARARAALAGELDAAELCGSVLDRKGISRKRFIWERINEYAEACGGDTSPTTVSDRRMRAVVAVESALAALAGEASGNGGPCQRCDGSGYEVDLYPDGSADRMCSGTGGWWARGEPCGTCNTPEKAIQP